MLFVTDEIDYTKHTESELVEMFSRLDPRYAPAECARLSKYLSEHGYIVTDGDTGPGSTAPSPEKLEELIGSRSPFECSVEFGRNKGFLNFIGWTRNQFGFTGRGTLVCDGIYVWISGLVAGNQLGGLVEENTQLPYHQIANVESADRVVRFEYNVLDSSQGDAISFWLADATAAARLVRVLPQRRTLDFQPRLAH
jgi:hypothetical protein